MYKNLEELRKSAIAVNRSDKEHSYCSKFEVLAFVIDGTMYAVPWTITALKILTDAGFSRKALKIPYGNELVAKDKEEYWNNLVKEARTTRII